MIPLRLLPATPTEPALSPRTRLVVAIVAQRAALIDQIAAAERAGRNVAELRCALAKMPEGDPGRHLAASVLGEAVMTRRRILAGVVKGQTELQWLLDGLKRMRPRLVSVS